MIEIRNIVILLLTLLLLNSCQSFIPKVKFALNDLHNVPIYGIYYKCTGSPEKHIQSTMGGIKGGEFYRGEFKAFSCDKGDKKIFYAFDLETFEVLFKYVRYLSERFNEL